MGPFVVVECIGNTAYHLDLSCSAALRGVHDVFHVLLLRGWLSNGVHANVPSIKIEDMWLSTAQLEHAPVLLLQYR